MSNDEWIYEHRYAGDRKTGLELDPTGAGFVPTHWHLVTPIESETMIVNKHEARRIAALWQSPGTIGRELAAFASGASVDAEELLWDIDATIDENGGPTDDLLALRAYVNSGAELS